MLMGEFFPKLDEKNRIILPAKFHGDFGGGIVLTRGQEHCVYGYTTRDFEEMYERLRQAPVSNKQGRNYLRLFLSAATDEVPDKQHRITLPASLREYAGLDRELAVIGVGSRIEIWDAQAWRGFIEEEEDGYSEIEEEVIPGMI